MPEISRFYGIIIRMFFREHAPPHFHAFYGEHQALINIEHLDWLQSGPYCIKMNSWKPGNRLARASH